VPPLDKPQHERFAAYVAKGLPYGKAYYKIGFAPANPKDATTRGGKLAKRPEVKARIKELQEVEVGKIGVSVESLVSELDDMLTLATVVRHPAAGIGAIMGKAKLLGLIVDKAETATTVRKPMREVKPMTLAEWEKTFAPKTAVLPDTPAKTSGQGGHS
jgi:hypothetical protein